MRKLAPFIPVIGIPLTCYYHLFKGKTGIENPIIFIITVLIQGISMSMLILFLTVKS